MISFGDKIRAAKDEKEVVNLLEQGKKLIDATDKTRRRWKRLATTRLNELSGKKEIPNNEVVAEPVITEPITKENKRLRKKDREAKENIA